MIYTVTFNPTLDYTIRLNCLELGKVNRTEEETLLSGRKRDQCFPGAPPFGPGHRGSGVCRRIHRQRAFCTV